MMRFTIDKDSDKTNSTCQIVRDVYQVTLPFIDGIVRQCSFKTTENVHIMLGDLSD